MTRETKAPSGAFPELTAGAWDWCARVLEIEIQDTENRLGRGQDTDEVRLVIIPELRTRARMIRGEAAAYDSNVIDKPR